ncbi:hypothetical protein CPB97_003554, partial [Podila verticillata]
LCLENILLKNKHEWDVILDGVYYSILQILSLQGSNIPDSQGPKGCDRTATSVYQGSNWWMAAEQTLGVSEAVKGVHCDAGIEVPESIG